MRSVSRFLLLLCLLSSASAQQTSADSASVVPTLVNFTGVLTDVSGKPLTSVVGITFSLYKDSQGGAALWMETQNVQPDKAGHYSATLGSTTSGGLSLELFASGEARWLGVQVQGQTEQPRILLLSVPYALKAKDAETLGGMPASAFVTTEAQTSSAQAGTSAAMGTTASTSAQPGQGAHGASAASSTSQSTASVGGTGTTNFIPRWTSSTALGNSALFQSSAGNVGLATISPTQRFEVDFGNLLVRGPNNFKKAGDTAFLYVGDTSHPIEAISNKGLAIGTFRVREALFIQDQTGNVGIGTTAPNAMLNVLSKNGLAGDFSSAKTGSNGLSATGGPGSAKVVGGTGFTATGGANKADGGTGGVGASFTGGNAAGINQPGIGGTGGFFHGGSGPPGDIFYGGIGLIGIGADGDSFVGSGGDGAHLTAGFGLGGGTGVVATGGGGDPSGCGGTFLGGPGVTQTGGSACVGGGNDAGFDIGADGIDATSVPSDARATYAGNFTGDLNVTGKIVAGTKDFRIDHPLDPANKYLSHASVESSEMKNIYDGTVTTDSQGNAVVDLPSWFEVVNGDFRYQLTVIGQFAQAIVAHKIANRQFSIKTDKPNVEVCWQVTGVRRDAFAKFHPLGARPRIEV